MKSSLFKSERAFCDAIENIIFHSKQLYSREARCPFTATRVDFWIAPGLIIEAKVDISIQKFDRAIGQIVRYKTRASGKISPWLVTPDDLPLSDWQKAITSAIGVSVFTLCEFAARFTAEQRAAA